MAAIVQCPHCSKKLKMQSGPTGKKVRCPACKEAFVPQAAAAARPKPKKKPKPRPVADDYVDFEDDDLYGDGDLQDDSFDDSYDEPAPARRSAGRKASAAAGRKKSKKGGKGKSSSDNRSKMPLIIGIVVVVLIAVGVGIFFAMNGGTGGEDVAEDDPTAMDPTAMDPTAMDPASQSMATPGAAESTSDDSGNSTATATSATPAGAPSNPASGSGAAVTAVLDPTYLPVDSELFAVIDVERLLSGPLNSMLPMFGPQLQQMKAATGLGVEDLSSVTLGVGGISKAAKGQRPPRPVDTPFILVVRTKKAIDSSTLQAAIPVAQQVSEGGISYLKIPENPPAAIWLADSTTAVIGVEDMVKQAATSGSSASSFDPALMDEETAIRIAFQPSDPDAVFRQSQLPPAPPMPGAAEAMNLVKAVQPGITAAGFGMDLGQDVKVFGAIRSKDEQAAQAAKTALDGFIENAKKTMEQQMAGNQMPGMSFGGGADSLESFEATTNGNMMQFSVVQKDGGQQLTMLAPMIAMSVQNARQTARQAAQRVSGQNNLKQVGLALHNFHSAWGRFPNAVPKDPSGKPLLSWRVHILEFLGPAELQLFQRFNLDEPWDSPTNRPLLAEMPDVYKSPGSNLSAGQTQVQLPVGPGTIFENGEGRRFRDITDGTSNTILVVETLPSNAVNWTEPVDWTFDPQDPMAGLSSGGQPFNAVFADGRAAKLSGGLGAAVAQALFSRNAGDFVPNNVTDGPAPGPGGFPGGPGAPIGDTPGFGPNAAGQLNP